MKDQLAPVSAGGGQKPRYYLFDYARCLTLLLVILYHVCLGLQHSGHVSVPPLLMQINESLRWMRMPTFFFASGFLFVLVFQSGRTSFMKSLMFGLVIPYIVWSEVYIGTKLAASDVTTHAITADAMFRIFIEPVDHFWFIYVLIFIRLIFLLNSKIDNGRYVYVITAAALVYFTLAMAYSIEVWEFSALARGALYFSVGVWAGQNSFLPGRGMSPPKAIMLAVAGATVYLLIELARLLIVEAQSPLLAAILKSAVLPLFGATALILLLSLVPAPKGAWTKLAAFISTASLAIYMIHPTVAAVVRIILVKLGIKAWFIHLPIGFIVALAVPTIGYLVASRLRLLPYLALGPNRAPKPAVAPAPSIPLVPEPSHSR